DKGTRSFPHQPVASVDPVEIAEGREGRRDRAKKGGARREEVGKDGPQRRAGSKRVRRPAGKG
ncbi:hypothetical protein AAVH_40427, partial [Aphelenchoides avenae]